MRHAVVISSYLFQHSIDIDGVFKALVEEARCMKEAGCERCSRIGRQVVHVSVLT